MATEVEQYVLGKKFDLLIKIDKNILESLEETLKNLNEATRKIDKWIKELKAKRDEFNCELSKPEIEFLEKCEDHDLEFYTARKVSIQCLKSRFEDHDKIHKDWKEIMLKGDDEN